MQLQVLYVDDDDIADIALDFYIYNAIADYAITDVALFDNFLSENDIADFFTAENAVAEFL